ncbi:unnamed protein product [Amoebophrya sp. A120]|nr:unnamed protein product [Amoebophrya sp. A120]|eukprot:GSA120T00025963001.1
MMEGYYNDLHVLEGFVRAEYDKPEMLPPAVQEVLQRSTPTFSSITAPKVVSTASSRQVGSKFEKDDTTTWITTDFTDADRTSAAITDLKSAHRLIQQMALDNANMTQHVASMREALQQAYEEQCLSEMECDYLVCETYDSVDSRIRKLEEDYPGLWDQMCSYCRADEIVPGDDADWHQFFSSIPTIERRAKEKARQAMDDFAATCAGIGTLFPPAGMICSATPESKTASELAELSAKFENPVAAALHFRLQEMAHELFFKTRTLKETLEKLASAEKRLKKLSDKATTTSAGDPNKPAVSDGREEALLLQGEEIKRLRQTQDALSRELYNENMLKYTMQDQARADRWRKVMHKEGKLTENEIEQRVAHWLRLLQPSSRGRAKHFMEALQKSFAWNQYHQWDSEMQAQFVAETQQTSSAVSGGSNAGDGNGATSGSEAGGQHVFAATISRDPVLAKQALIQQAGEIEKLKSEKIALAKELQQRVTVARYKELCLSEAHPDLKQELDKHRNDFSKGANHCVTKHFEAASVYAKNVTGFFQHTNGGCNSFEEQQSDAGRGETGTTQPPRSAAPRTGEATASNAGTHNSLPTTVSPVPAAGTTPASSSSSSSAAPRTLLPPDTQVRAGGAASSSSVVPRTAMDAGEPCNNPSTQDSLVATRRQQSSSPTQGAPLRKRRHTVTG